MPRARWVALRYERTWTRWTGSRLDRFELHDQAIGDEQIDAAIAHGMRLVLDRDGYLSLEWNLPKSQLDAESALVDGLEESWAEHAMNPDGSTHDCRCELLQLLVRLLKTIPWRPDSMKWLASLATS